MQFMLYFIDQRWDVAQMQIWIKELLELFLIL